MVPWSAGSALAKGAGMNRRSRARLVLSSALSLGGALLFASPARAADPVVVVRDHGSWSEALAALRSDLGSKGNTIHLGVTLSAVRVSCEHYRLQLDALTKAAFRVGACDPATDEVPLVLEHREELFDHRSYVPTPRASSITATVIHQGTAVADDGPEGGSVVRCSWAVRPYLDDAEHGTRVLLTPEHYTLRSGSAWVQADPDGAGWTLSTTERASFHVEYEVLDRAAGSVVLKHRMTLACHPEGDADPTPPGTAAGPRQPAPRVEVPPDPQRPRVNATAGMFSGLFLIGAGSMYLAGGLSSDSGVRAGTYVTGTMFATAGIGAFIAFAASLSSFGKPHAASLPPRVRLAAPTRSGLGFTF
jgi:hypothetical protein